MRNLSVLILTLSFTISCTQSRRSSRPGASWSPWAQKPPIETLAVVVDQDFHLEVVEANGPTDELVGTNLVLQVQTTVADHNVISLVTDPHNTLLPTFELVKRDESAGLVQAKWSTNNDTFAYEQRVEGFVRSDLVELTYATKLVYKADGKTIARQTKVAGWPRGLKDPASLDAEFTLDWNRYGRHDYPKLNCPWFRGRAPASEVYRLDVYDRGTDAIRVVIDHGEVEFTLDRRPLPGQKMFWHVPAMRGRFWDPFSEGSVWVHGTLSPKGVDLNIKYVPKPFFLAIDPDDLPDPEAPGCWFDYHAAGGPKRQFNGVAVDGYYRLRENNWDQCNTWPTGSPARVVTESVVDVVKDPTGPRFKILDRFGFVSEFLLATGNGFSAKEDVVYNDGSLSGAKVTIIYQGSFNSPLFEETTYALYPKGCVVKIYAFGHARYSF